MWCRRARWRIRCHVRSLPPLSSGRSRPALSQRIFMVCQSVPARLPTGSGRRVAAYAAADDGAAEVLHAVAVNPGAVPEFEIEKAPEHVAALGAAGRVIVEQPRDLHGVEQPALARAPIEQHVADDAVPGSARPDARTAPGTPSSGGGESTRAAGPSPPREARASS